MPPPSPFTASEQKMLKRAWAKLRESRQDALQRRKAHEDARATGDEIAPDLATRNSLDPVHKNWEVDWGVLYKSSLSFLNNHSSKERKSWPGGLPKAELKQVLEAACVDVSLNNNKKKRRGETAATRAKVCTHKAEKGWGAREGGSTRGVTRTAGLTEPNASLSPTPAKQKLIMEVVLAVCKRKGSG
ncbi:hypothetical protein RhiJN_07884 [Ceratobasidium sp. AG-Ba]|nr:hypothetical protein RhiJN_07884 [Ceratobasidium sp. AG-Ba]QRW08721.1 hypothetical protein RhiLY_07720 [Ceratobasidium sp. AG-Ba]